MSGERREPVEHGDRCGCEGCQHSRQAAFLAWYREAFPDPPPTRRQRIAARIRGWRS